MHMKFILLSKSLRDIRCDIDEKGVEIMLHLIKVFVFRRCNSYDHWKSEIHAFLPKVSKLKRTNKYPKSDFIFHALWDNQKDDLEKFLKWILTDYTTYDKLVVVNSNIQQLGKFIDDYLHWLSEELSKKGFVSRVEVSSKIDNLLKEF